MNTVDTWGEAIVLALQNVWIKFITFLPEVLGALIILVIGLFIASALGKLVKKLISFTKIDKLLSANEFFKQIEGTDLKFSFAGLVGWIVKWFFIIVSLIAVADILHWGQVNIFLSDIALYIPRVVIAIVILMIGLISGKFLHDVVKKSVGVSKLPNTSAGPLSVIAKWSVIIFAFLAALVQLGIATSLIEIFFTGFVAMLAIAGGLAFGLGGKDKARDWLDKLDKEIKEN